MPPRVAFEQLGTRDAVGIEEQDHVSGDGGGAEVARPARSEAVPFLTHMGDAKAIGELGHQARDVLGRAVIGHGNGEAIVRQRLGEKAGQRTGEQVSAVVDRDDDTEVRCTARLPLGDLAVVVARRRARWREPSHRASG